MILELIFGVVVYFAFRAVYSYIAILKVPEKKRFSTGKAVYGFLMLLQLPLFIYLITTNIEEYYFEKYGWKIPLQTFSRKIRLTAIVVMAVIYHFKFFYYFIFITTYHVPVHFGIIVSFLRATHTFGPYLIATLNADSIGFVDFIAVAVFCVGFVFEFVSEFQRHLWKRDPNNKGKPYTEGLFSWAQHINYLGFGLVNFSFFLLAGTHFFACVLLLLYLINFVQVGIPQTQKCGLQKYGHNPKYLKYTANTAKMIPFIY